MKISLTIIQPNGKSTSISIQPNQQLHIGKPNQGNNIEFHDDYVSRKHAFIELKGNRLTITDKGSTNKTFVNGKTLQESRPFLLKNGDEIKFARQGSTIRVRVSKPNTDPVTEPVRPGNVDNNTYGTPLNNIAQLLNRKNDIIIGRLPVCDITLDDLMVSRQHTGISVRNGQYYIRDLGSKNGTFVNGQRISHEKAIKPDDTIRIASHVFQIQGQVINIRNSEYAIEAEDVAKIYSNGRGLHRMSLKVRQGSFVALMGPSGCGKSTLLKALNGDNPKTDGIVKINRLLLNKDNFDYIKTSIGYVPQDDIVHKDLSVQKTLYYAAKLRMADDISDGEINKRIDEVLTDLNINNPKIRKNKIKDLSGGQRKRISIAVELLNNPSILFLDEPTSPLDPETIGSFLESIQKLIKKKKTTVIMVTHKPSDLDYVDEVIFLSSGGWHAFTGTPQKLLSHFNTTKIIDIYSELKDEGRGKDRYNSWYNRNPLSQFRERPITNQRRKRTNNLFRQYYWLSIRYANIKLNDMSNMGILMAQSFIIAGLLRFTYDSLQLGVLFLMAISAIWFGVNNAAREIVSESAIYKRERMVNLNIFTYLFSKLTILSIIAILQVLIFVGIIYYGYDGQEVYLYDFKSNFIFMSYLAFSATLFGLFLSTLFKTTEKVLSMVPLALIPQIILAGVVATIDSVFKEILSYFSLGRWGTEGLSYVQDNKGFAMESDTTTATEGVMRLVVDPLHGENTQEEPGSAIEALNFYPDSGDFTSLELFNDGALGGYWTPITILNLAMFIGIFYLLKRKDSIKK